MKLVLLGTGGPMPDPQRHGSAVLLETQHHKVLFDAGRGVVLQLTRAGIALPEIGPVFLTHHHYDHIGDLADLMLTSWLTGRSETLQVFGPRGTADIVDALVTRVYAKDIEFRAKGEPHWGGWAPVEAVDIVPGLVYSSNKIRVFAEHVEHGQGLGIPDFDWVTLGYRVEADGRSVAISGDTIPCEGLDNLARGADVLVQCCYLADAEVTNPHLERLARFTLATGSQVGKIAARAGVGKLVLTHFRPKSPEMMDVMVGEVRQHFSGVVVVGEDLTEVEV